MDTFAIANAFNHVLNHIVGERDIVRFEVALRRRGRIEREARLGYMEGGHRSNISLSEMENSQSGGLCAARGLWDPRPLLSVGDRDNSIEGLSFSSSSPQGLNSLPDA